MNATPALMRAVPALLVALASVAATTPARALSASELYRRLAPSVWVVHTYDADGLPLGQGSAVVTGPQSLVTNCHVLRKGKRVEITHEKSRLPVLLELWDTARDLCQLKAPGLDAPAVALGDDQALSVGQPVYALGSPAGLELTLSSGIVSALRRDESQVLTVVQTSAAISPGSSGGGLFDEQGRLIGITSGAYTATNAQSLNIAIPIGMVRELPERHAAAQRAKAAASEPPAGGAAAPPANVAALSGIWSGEYRCSAYKGPGKVEFPNAWNVPVVMTVSTAGQVAIVRTDATMIETVTGEVATNLAVDLKGRGVFKAQPNGYHWLTHVTGRFAADASSKRFDGRGEMTTPAGVVTRECGVTLSRSGGTG